jgi:hypothetical protein
MVFRDRICGFALLAIGALGGVSAHPAKKTWSGGAGAGAGNTTGALPVVDLKYVLQRATSYNVSYLVYSIFLFFWFGGIQHHLPPNYLCIYCRV